jgi:hypothetical protein
MLGVGVALMLLTGCGSDPSRSGGVAGPMPTQSTEAILGVWGAEHIRMTIGREGAVIQYDCGEGSIDTAIVPDAEGRFQAEGTFTSGGGPDPVAGRPQQAAIYTGTILGSSMELSGTVIDTGQSLGSFTLRFSDDGLLVRCY